ncbi:MAG: hypothetical protein DCC54_13330 [Anaerolineae bacterium]|nr:MAG: hypothetical protein DCC54_13330 [Anaerolineae bacterium]
MRVHVAAEETRVAQFGDGERPAHVGRVGVADETDPFGALARASSCVAEMKVCAVWLRRSFWEGVRGSEVSGVGVSGVRFGVSGVRFQVSGVRFQVSGVEVGGLGVRVGDSGVEMDAGPQEERRRQRAERRRRVERMGGV